MEAFHGSALAQHMNPPCFWGLSWIHKDSWAIINIEWLQELCLEIGVPSRKKEKKLAGWSWEDL